MPSVVPRPDAQTEAAKEPFTPSMQLTLLLAVVTPSFADIVVSRTVNSISNATANVTIEGPACTDKDQYGSNSCDVTWGSSYTVDYAVTLAEDLTAGAQVHVDVKLDSVVPFKFSCAVCGADCSITVPIIKKSYKFEMPPCPISKQSLSDRITKALPAKSPVPLKISLKGNVQVTDQAGGVIADVDVEGKVGPSGLALELEREVEAVYD